MTGSAPEDAPPAVLALRASRWRLVLPLCWATVLMASAAGLVAAVPGLLANRNPAVTWLVLAAAPPIWGLGMVLAGLCVTTLRAPAPVIEIGPAGLLDRRLAGGPIPWNRLRWRLVRDGRNRSTAVFLDTDLPLAPPWPWRVLSLVNRRFGHPRLSVLALGTGADGETLARHMAVHRPPEPG